MNKEQNHWEEILDDMTEKFQDPAFGDQDIDVLCGTYPKYESDIRSTWRIWKDLDSLESPVSSGHLRSGFQRTLREFEEETRSGNPAKYVHINTLWRWAAIFIVGFGLGMLLSTSLLDQGNNRITQRNGQQKLLTQLTSGVSTSDRLSVVQGLKDIRDPQDYVFEALYSTLTNDPNVNVRLSAIESLLYFANYPRARELLVNALAYQDTPIVQITLAEVVIKLQEEGTLEEIQKLMDSEKVDLEVKMHLEETLNL